MANNNDNGHWATWGRLFNFSFFSLVLWPTFALGRSQQHSALGRESSILAKEAPFGALIRHRTTTGERLKANNNDSDSDSNINSSFLPTLSISLVVRRSAERQSAHIAFIIKKLLSIVANQTAKSQKGGGKSFRWPAAIIIWLSFKQTIACCFFQILWFKNQLVEIIEKTTNTATKQAPQW